MQGCYSREGWWHISPQFLSFSNIFSPTISFQIFSRCGLKASHLELQEHWTLSIDSSCLISHPTPVFIIWIWISLVITIWLCRTVFTEPCCRGPPALTAQYYLSCCSAAVSLLQHLTWITPDHCRWQFENIFCKTRSINLEHITAQLTFGPNISAIIWSSLMIVFMM